LLQTIAGRLPPGTGQIGLRENDHLEFAIPYEYLDVSHAYIPDFLVRLEAGVTLILEIKGYQNDQDLAKHQAVNNWGQLGRGVFHVCKDPQMLGQELTWLGNQTAGMAAAST
jgi:type III restriction enzyme